MEERRLAVIVFTDIVGYSRMVQTDEGLALELLEEHNRIVGELIDGKGGRTLKTAGDSFLASFESAGAAVAAAAGIQQALAVRNEPLPEERQLHIRIGIHAGDVVFTDDPAGGRDVLGDGVNVASRVEAQAGADEVFVSHDVFSITYDRVPFGYRDVGVRDLKNISRPIHIYELLWDPARAEEADAKPPRASAGPSKSGRVGMFVAIIAVAAAAAVIIFSPSQITDDPLEARPALAVLGIEDQTGDEGGYLGRIAHDAVEQYFYEFQPIRLVSPLRVAKARRELGVTDGNLEMGTVDSLTQLAGGRLAVTGQLSRRGEALHLRTQLFDLQGEGQVLVRRSWTAGSDDELLSLIDSACAAFQDRLSDVFGFEIEEGRIAPIGEMTTKSLVAYQHFVRGHDLTYAGYFDEGAEELIRATQVDSQFALAYSLTACTFSFAKKDSLSAHYFDLATKYADERLRAGTGLGSLIFQGNTAWGEGDSKTSCDRYRLATELYPDEREGFLYHGLCQQYLVASEAQSAGDEAARTEALEAAVENYQRAASLSPGFFPIYFDWAYVTKDLEGTDAAVRLLSSYLRDYGDGPGGDAARRQLAQLRSAG